MDLGSFASVRNAAMRLDATLDVLICNAAVMAVPYGMIEDSVHHGYRYPDSIWGIRILENIAAIQIVRISTDSIRG